MGKLDGQGTAKSYPPIEVPDIPVVVRRVSIPVMDEAGWRQLFQDRFNCWTCVAGEDPDVMAMTEGRFIEVLNELGIICCVTADGGK